MTVRDDEETTYANIGDLHALTVAGRTRWPYSMSVGLPVTKKQASP